MTKSFYAKRRIEKTAERNNLNRQRAAAMERSTALYLDGYKVPSSGASWMKGDVRIDTSYGQILVECKLSSLIHNSKGPMIIFREAWLEKALRDATSMKCVFGSVIFRYHGQVGKGYAVVTKDTFDRMHPHAYETYTARSLKHSIYLFNVDMPKDQYKVLLLSFPLGEFIVYPVEQFREDIHNANVF